MNDRIWRNIERANALYLERNPPPWHQTVVPLIDALRMYIWASVEEARDLYNEGSITKEEYEKPDPELAVCRSLLRALEKHEVDPSLNNIIPWEKLKPCR